MPHGTRQIAYAQLRIATPGRPNLADLQALLELAKAAGVPRDATPVVEGPIFRVEAVVSSTTNPHDELVARLTPKES